MTDTRHRLLLFDIDETLVRFTGISLPNRLQAIRDVLRMDDILPGDVEPYGKTDPQIIMEIMRANAIEEGIIASSIDQICKRFIHLMINGLDKAERRYTYPGVEKLLGRLSTMDHITLGILTGNMEPVADAKLDYFDLRHYFTVGAYGSDNSDRTKLPETAMGRAGERLGLNPSPEDTFIIGDSPRDVECGRKAGARTIAVATGIYSMEDLAASAPDHLLEDLCDTDGFVEIVS